MDEMYFLIIYPAKNISKNQEPGTANPNIASSVMVSFKRRNGIQARIKKLLAKKIDLAGS